MEGVQDRVVKTDLDTFLTALYVFCDDQLIPPHRPRPGRRKKLSDAELVCLAMAQILLGYPSQHHWPRVAYGRLGHLFGYLPHQPGYHKRLVAAAPLILRAIQMLATQVPSQTDTLRLIDATPLPCGTSRKTAKRSELAGWAGTATAPHTRGTTGVSSSTWSPPASHNAYSPSPPPSGTTGPSTHPSNDPSSPTTTEDLGINHLVSGGSDTSTAPPTASSLRARSSGVPDRHRPG